MIQKRQYCFRAFTIIEIVVIMMLSLLVIAGGMTVFQYISGNFNRSVSSLKTSNEVLQLYGLLRMDFEKSDFVRVEDDAYRLLSDSSDIRYEINKTYILRQTEFSSDTFDYRVKTNHVEFYKYDETLVCSISIKLIHVNDSFTFTIAKQYSPASVVNHLLFKEKQ